MIIEAKKKKKNIKIHPYTEVMKGPVLVTYFVSYYERRNTKIDRLRKHFDHDSFQIA